MEDIMRKLRFDAADPNVLCRFQQALGRLEDVKRALGEQTDPLTALWQADQELKGLLSWVLGCDVDAAVSGRSLLSMEGEKTLLEDLLDKLGPVLLQGARDWADAQRARYGNV